MKQMGKMEKKLPPGMYWRNKIIHIDYCDGHGNRMRISTGGDNIADARALLEEKRTEVRMGKFPILNKGKKIKFADLAKEFIDEYQGGRGELAESSRKNYQILLKRLVEFFGHLALDQISKKDIAKYIKERKQATVKGMGKNTISPFTINREMGTLRLVLNWAVDQGQLGANPVAKELARKRLFKEPPRTRFFSDDEISAILANARGPMKHIILVGINTGMRLSEILGLRWDEVDIKGRSITIPAERTKNKEAREIRLNSTMIELFQQLKLNRGGQEYVLPNPETGKPFNKSISHGWKRLLKRAGVQPGRFHDLRRTFITRAAKAGANVKDIQVMVGHKDFTTTMKVYAQATKEGQQRVADLANFSEPAGEVIELPAARVVK